MAQVAEHNHDLRYYRRAEIDYRFQPSYLLAKLKAADGPGSGLDADTVDGSHASAFALLAGQAGGQTLYGGTASGDDLSLHSTSHATKGDVLINPAGGNVGIGTDAANGVFDVKYVNGTYPVNLLVSGGGLKLQEVGNHATDPTPIMTFQRGRGTSLASPSAISASDLLFAFQAGGYDGVAFRSGWNGGVHLAGYATENWDSTHRGADFRISTSAMAATSASLRLIVNENGARVFGSLLVDGDGGGVAGAVGFTDVTAGISTGSGTVKMNGATARNSAGWLKIYVGTTAAYIPYWTTITG